MFDERDPATWAEVPRDYVWKMDPVTGELYLFAPDGRNLTVPVGGPKIGEFPPETAVNAAIVAAMREHAYSAEWAERLRCYQWCDMSPVVTRAETLPTPNEWGDSWVIEVQYSTGGARAVYGVNRDNVPQCYAD